MKVLKYKLVEIPRSLERFYSNYSYCFKKNYKIII